MSEPKHSPRTLGVLLAMTAITGTVDAVSFLALGHVFTANMTGNVVFLAFAFAGTPGLSIERSSLALFCFAVGAVLGGRMTTGAKPARWVQQGLWIEAVLLLAAAVASSRMRSPADGQYPLVQTVRIVQPSNYARTVLIEALRKEGVRIDASLTAENPVALLPSTNSYPRERKLAELKGMPYSEEAKFILKVSYNIGAALATVTDFEADPTLAGAKGQVRARSYRQLSK